MRAISLAAAVVLLTLPSTSPPLIEWNDNRVPAGRRAGNALTLDLTVVEGSWHVLGPEHPAVPMLAFAEAGRAPRIPGPLLRVREGTDVRVTISNPLDRPLVVHGLYDRKTQVPDSVVVPAGGQRETRFRASAEGTYYYWATVTGVAFDDRVFEDSQLHGAFIVDPAGAPAARDRIMVISLFFNGRNDNGGPDGAYEYLTINGRPWPYTERFTYDTGDTVRWRLINASNAPHPMHLHGFFYRVDARGDNVRDTLYWPAQRRQVVTERLAPGTTMAMTWSPDRPGNWIFHCHLTFHVLPNPRLPKEPREERFAHAFGMHGDPMGHMTTGMGGLMVAMTVRPPPGWRMHEPERLRFRLFVHTDSTDGAPRRWAYVLQEGDRDPAPDSVPSRSSGIRTWRGTPTSVWVINRTHEPTQVHWHGLEIDSYYDGVTGLGGHQGMPTPPILPGDSFEMRITPPRAGSFMYHTHMNDVLQQGGGLYASFLVLDSGAAWDPARDLVFLAGASAPFGPPSVNGTTTPDTLRFTVGTRYRFRLMNITLGNPNLMVRLTRDGAPFFWTPVAEDGHDLPSHRQVSESAQKLISNGQTFDYAFTPPAPGQYDLEFRSFGGRLFVRQVIVAAPPPPSR